MYVRFGAVNTGDCLVIRRHVLNLLGSALVIGLLPTTALAQSGSGVPTREEINRLPAAPQGSTARPSISADNIIERAPCPLAGAQFNDLKFTLTAVDFGDTKGIPADIFKSAYARYLGQSLPVASICDIRDEAATILRRQGYLAAVQVPPQRIEGGTVKFDVLLAKLVGFQVRGNAGKAEKLITGYLDAIKEQPVFNVVEAERYLLLARDIPGYDVRLTLRPAGTVPGEVIGEVQVVYSPIELDVNVQNYGSREVGRFGGLVQARVNGLLGAGDRTTIGFYSTANFKEQHVIQAGQEFRVGREGLTLSADFTHAWTSPSLGFGSNLKSKTLVASLSARYPLIRRQSTNLFASGGFDYVNQRARFNGIPLSVDKLRVVYAKLEFDASDSKSVASSIGYSAAEPRWRTGGSFELRQGVDVFGASKDCGVNFSRCNAAGAIPLTRLEGDPTAFVARATGHLEFRPIPILAFSLSPRLQYSPNALLSYEEFSAGTFTIGRGYDPGSLIGDSGIGVTEEVKFGSLIPQSQKDFAFQAYAFLDAAWVWNKDREFDGRDPGRLLSAGGGIRAAYGDRVSIDIGGAIPLKTVGLATSKGPIRLLMTATVRLLPASRQ